MTILESNANRLVVRVKPSWQLLLFVGMCWFLGLIFAFRPEARTFTCQRVEPREGSCELTITALLDSSTQRINLDQIKEARVSTSTTTDSRGKQSTDYHVLLQTASSSVLIASVSDSNEQQQWADQINAFLARADLRAFTLSRDGRLGLYAVSAVFLGFGLWLAILIFRVTTYFFDKTLGSLAIEQRLIGTWTKEYPLDDICDLEIRLQENRRGNRADTGWLYLQLKSGQRIATNLPPESDLIDSLRSFLGIKLPW